MPGVRNIFCQRSVNNRNTCLIGFRSRSIPGERRLRDTLPSKQVITSSSPIFHTKLEASLQILLAALDEKATRNLLPQFGPMPTMELRESDSEQE